MLECLVFLVFARPTSSYTGPAGTNLGAISRPISSYTGPAAAIFGVLARPISSYTGPAGAIGTSLPDSCLFAKPNHKCKI